MIIDKTTLTVEEVKRKLINSIYRRLNELNRTTKGDSFKKYRELLDDFCISEKSKEIIVQYLVSEILKIEKYSDKNFKLIFGKKKSYDLQTPTGRKERRESWTKTTNSRNLKRSYWESRRK
jgi:hypothetical protein